MGRVVLHEVTSPPATLVAELAAVSDDVMRPVGAQRPDAKWKSLRDAELIPRRRFPVPLLRWSRQINAVYSPARRTVGEGRKRSRGEVFRFVSNRGVVSGAGYDTGGYVWGPFLANFC